MNNPLNTHQSSKDLVLRLIGGERDGQLFTVHNEKCLLTDLSGAIQNAENYRCVIFRGEKGVAFRSYSDHVLCNGAKVSVQWLKKGDLIKLTDNFSVEVYQLGVYTKKPAAAAKSSQPPVQKGAVPRNVNSSSSENTAVDSHGQTITTPTASPAISASSTATGSAPVPRSTYEVKPSVQFPTISPPPAADARNPQSAAANLSSAMVTAPLPIDQSPTESTATADSVSPMIVAAEALDVASTDLASSASGQSETIPSKTNSLLESEVPTAPSNATIDSLTDRLSKLVQSAGDNGEIEFGDSQSNDTSLSARPSVSPMPIAPTRSEPADNVQQGTSQQATTPSLVQAQPASPPVTGPITGNAPAQTIPNSTTAPAAATTADSPSPTGVAAQPSAADSAAQRRAALENYFSKNGVSLSDAITPPADDKAPPEVLSQEPTVAANDAATTAADEAPAVASAATSAPAAAPQFDLDSVLAKLESGSTTLSPQTPAADPAEAQQPPTGGPLATETPVAASQTVSSTVAQTHSVQDAPEQPPIETEHKDGPTSEATSDEQGGQLESFALLQSLGLDTSGLGQIKKELSQPPLSEEVQSSNLDNQQQADPEAPEPEKVESVADVLARMQNAGSLEDFNAGEDQAESPADEIAQPIVPTPPPAAAPVAAAPVSSPASEAPSSSPVQGGNADDDGSVEDYMSQLLNRMRGDSEPTSGEVAEQNQDKAVEAIAAEQQMATAVSATEPQKVETLTPEEFVPKQKAVRMQSLDSLREIANSNAREAFRDSLARERKVSTQTKLKLSLVSLGFAVLFVLMSYIGEKVNFWGVVLGIGFLIIGLLTARAYLSERKLDESILSD